MSPQGRSQCGRFSAKSDENREVRSLRLTDAAWRQLGDLAASRNITRADLVEEWTLGQPASRMDLDQAIAKVLSDPVVTRNGKDRGSVRRALEALRNYLS